MLDYYKLVKPDLSSFHDSSFKWPLTGIVEVPNAASLGRACGPGLHLARTVRDGLWYARFPFRIIRVRPLSMVLWEDGSKIRVAKAEALGEIPVPAWAKKIEERIKNLPEEIKAIPWFNGDDPKTASKLVRSHFKLLVPFGFRLDFDIEIVTERKDAAAARDVARAFAGDVAWFDAWASARDVARDAVTGVARDVTWSVARDVAGDVARAAASDVARDVVWDASWAAAMDASWDVADGLLNRSNPFKPLWECWKTGAWPIGFVGNKFKIFVPREKPCP